MASGRAGRLMAEAAEAFILYTYADLAERTGITAATLRVWHLRGKLPAPDYTIGQSPAWKPETVAEWIETVRTGPEAPEVSA